MYIIINGDGRCYNGEFFRTFDDAVEYFEEEGLCVNEFQIVEDDY